MLGGLFALVLSAIFGTLWIIDQWARVDFVLGQVRKWGPWGKRFADNTGAIALVLAFTGLALVVARSQRGSDLVGLGVVLPASLSILGAVLLVLAALGIVVLVRKGKRPPAPGPSSSALESPAQPPPAVSRRPREHPSVDHLVDQMVREHEYSQTHPLVRIGLDPTPRHADHHQRPSMIWAVTLDTSSDRIVGCKVVIEDGPLISNQLVIAGDGRLEVVPGMRPTLSVEVIQIVDPMGTSPNPQTRVLRPVYYMMGGRWEQGIYGAGSSRRHDLVLRTESDSGRVDRVTLDVQPETDPPTVTVKGAQTIVMSEPASSGS